METHSSDTSYIIRHDFMRFSMDIRTTKGKKEETNRDSENHLEAGLEAARNEMTSDDGLGSLGKYKCPIF